MNNRISARERGLIKGALRRVFSRSELRRKVIDASIRPHSDPKRPKVKVWCKCAVCTNLEAKSYMVVDHITPVIPVHTSFEEMGADATIERLWCDIENLQAICPLCHDEKTAKERAERKKLKPKKKAKK